MKQAALDPSLERTCKEITCTNIVPPKEPGAKGAHKEYCSYKCRNKTGARKLAEVRKNTEYKAPSRRERRAKQKRFVDLIQHPLTEDQKDGLLGVGLIPLLKDRGIKRKNLRTTIRRILALVRVEIEEQKP